MSRYNKTTAKPAGHSPVTSEPMPSGATHEGARGYTRDPKSELFLLAVSYMGDNTFYETARDRDTRFAQLARVTACADPAWYGQFTAWLRDGANMRTASLIAAAEGVKGRLDSKLAPAGRRWISGACKRADEPGELFAYWHAKYGRKLPKPVKRGLADAAARLYSEWSLLKYDTASHGYRFGDILELTHPPVGDSALFKYAIDRRHNRAPGEITGLPMVDAQMHLRAQAAGDNPRILLDSEALKRAGMTWEDALSLAGDKLPKAELWAALIPSMGYMALLRNLRNFDQAGVTDATAGIVTARLTDPEQVKRSRQFPFRFLAAYQAAASLRWSYPLEQALNLSLANVPALAGRTLILVDRSGSMFDRMSARSELTRADSAAVFGSALALRAAAADLVEFGTGSRVVPVSRAESVLKVIGRFGNLGGTNTAQAVRSHYSGHDRVVIVTDEQAWGGYYGEEPTRQVPAHVPVYTWNLAGYQYGHGPSGSANRHVFGGMTDQAFAMIPLLEAGRDGAWPWA